MGMAVAVAKAFRSVRSSRSVTIGPVISLLVRCVAGCRSAVQSVIQGWRISVDTYGWSMRHCSWNNVMIRTKVTEVNGLALD